MPHCDFIALEDTPPAVSIFGFTRDAQGNRPACMVAGLPPHPEYAAGLFEYDFPTE